MKHANFTQAMRVHHVWKIQRHAPSRELPYEWFSVWLDESILPGTGASVAEAFEAAVRDLERRAAA